MKKTIAFFITLIIMMTSCFSIAPAEQNTNDAPTVIPAIREWQGGNGVFVPNTSTALVNPSSSDSVEKVKGYFSKMLSLELAVTSEKGEENQIVFLKDASLKKTVGNEGYVLEASENGIVVKAATDTGLLYGGITIVQCLSAESSFPCGTAVDYPEYSVRSGMLDVGRAWIPLDYVKEITQYMAYFKMNEIHLHINDDGENDYSAFRLESDVKGLTSTDGYYTKDEYRAYQKEMLGYGVTVVTEIDTPYHSRCYSKAENPPPYLPDNDRCLDISKPETLEFVKALFAEYMTGDDPVFVGKVVHIGTDEYPREYAELMRAYTNELIEYINLLGYTPRFWGGLGEGGFQGTTPISDKAQLNYWDNHISGLTETLASNYDFVNTVNNALYTVPTTNYGFPDYYDLKTLYENWQVCKFAVGDTEYACEPDDEHLLGASFALWNDLHTAYKGVTRFDIFDRLRGMICLISEKTWCGTDTSDMPYESFKERYDILSLRAGDADPGRHSLSTEGISIDFDTATPEYVTLNGNVKDGAFTLDGESYISIETGSVGFPNTLEFEIYLEEKTQAPIFSGDGVTILADADGKGSFGFKSELYTFTYPYQIPIGEKVKIRLSSSNKTTYLTVNDNLSYAPHNALNPNDTKLSTLTIPLKEIGNGIKGYIDNISVVPYAAEFERLLAKFNLASNATATVSGLEVYDGRMTAENALDGNESTRLSFARDKDEQWLLLDLGAEYPVSTVEISFFEHISAYEIYTSTDGNEFTKVYEISNGTEQVKQTDTIVLESPVNARYIKYVQLKRWYMADWNAYYSGGICEFRVYSFNEERYASILDEANAFLKSCDISDPRRESVRRQINELKAYLKEQDMFTANLEYMYTALSDLINEEPQSVSSEVENSIGEQTQNNEDKKPNLVPIIASAAALAVAALVAVIILKKKRKKK